jgi:hypothetical protein
MSERRKFKRRHLIYYLRVFEQGGRNLLGHVADITTEGFMLVSDNTIKPGQTYSLWIQLPQGTSYNDRIEFKAETRWCKPDINQDFFDTGFIFVDISESDWSQISNLIQQSGFND